MSRFELWAEIDDIFLEIHIQLLSWVWSSEREIPSAPIYLCLYRSLVVWVILPGYVISGRINYGNRNPNLNLAIMSQGFIARFSIHVENDGELVTAHAVFDRLDPVYGLVAP
jgi:hypothetical protein